MVKLVIPAVDDPQVLRAESVESAPDEYLNDPASLSLVTRPPPTGRSALSWERCASWSVCKEETSRKGRFR